MIDLIRVSIRWRTSLSFCQHNRSQWWSRHQVWKKEKIVNCSQGCGSGFFSNCGSGSGSECGSGSRVLMIKNWEKNYSRKFVIFFLNCNFLIPSLHKWTTKLQEKPSAETWKILNFFFYFMGHFALLNPDPQFWMGIQITTSGLKERKKNRCPPHIDVLSVSDPLWSQ